MIKTIILDLDGVITDFCIGVYKAFSQPYNYPYLTRKYKFWDDWDGVTTAMVDFVCNDSFWQFQPWIHDGHDILREITKQFDPEQIYLATYPMPNVESPTGKWKWVKENLPEYYSRTIITQAPKSLLAKPDTLLLDDKDENIEEFVKAGGNAILVPRPWNELHEWADETYQVVKNSLENLK